MNPDFPYKKTVDYIIYTLKHPDGRTVTFKVYPTRCDGVYGYVLVTGRGGDEDARHLHEDARKIWYNLVGQGYLPVNKSVVHDMKKFHKAYKEYEDDCENYLHGVINKKHQKYLASKMYKGIMEMYENEYKNKNKYSNYALEA